MQTTYCRWAPSLGELESSTNTYQQVWGHEQVWGTKDYDWKKHRNESVVMFGLYDLRDYIALWQHRGKVWILWTGSDLRNLKNGFIFNDGKLRFLSKIFRGNGWLMPLLKKAEHWVENEWEYDQLAGLGIKSRICPSFLGDINNFPITYKHSDKPNVFISGHSGREEEYGFGWITKLAERVPECMFHLYGSNEWGYAEGKKNIVFHGKVSRETFNAEIQNYQCGLRLNKSDGFSEITAKNILNGGYPITYLKYPMIDNFETEEELVRLLKELKNKKEPNHKARQFYYETLNNFPWNTKKH